MTLRSDHRQWLIYQEAPVSATVRGVEAFLMGLGAQALLGHPEIALRALANVGRNMSDTRMDMWRGNLKGYEPTDEERQVVEHLDAIVAYLAGQTAAPTEALDELHAALVWIDKRAKAAGVIGDGWYRGLVRGE